MADDALAPRMTRSSATVISTAGGKHVFFQEGEFQAPVSFQN